ncbi:hypothetical protein KBC79_06295 [Candidatus Woesebacteria bacterium]|nr:hypothetical protein [Candidatus Woesebacteria bacterium]
MKLFLASEAKHPESLEKLRAFVGGFKGKSIAYIPTAANGENPYGESEAGASLFPGLGYIDFEIYPHFEDEMLPEIKKHWKGNKLCLLKNGEAITVVNDQVTILGEERFLEGKVT